MHLPPGTTCQSVDWSQRLLGLLGILSALTYVALLVLSFEFSPGENDPPILRALALLTLATVCWLAALGVLMRRASGAGEATSIRRSLGMVLGFAVVFRLLMLPSWPVQEIDYYRYLWDGRVTLDGGNPYHFSPWAVLATGPHAPPSSEVNDLWLLASQSDSVRTILERVHYPQIPTAYPPVAQGVFALAAALTPADAPVYVHLLVWKAALLVFDLGTILLIVLLLRRLGLPAGWCLAYAWCPLVLKEFANSGHFDAIAVFFTTLTLYLLCGVKATADTAPASMSRAVWACVVLGLAILAKSYPIVLLPLVAAVLLAWLGRRALVPLSAVVAVVVAGYLPFFLGGESTEQPPASAAAIALDVPEPSHPGSGLGAFLSQWEMNDFLFMLVKENLREPAAETDRWFTLVPSSWRELLHQEILIPLASTAGLPVQTRLALLATQCIMGSVLLVLTLRWAGQVYRQPEPAQLLRAAFLTLAWAWLLSSTQNPWYLVWCLPLVIFDGRKTWFLLPGLVLLYYVGFWLERQARTPAIELFEASLVWLEFLPFLMLLGVETWWTRAVQTPSAEPGEPIRGALEPRAVPADAPLRRSDVLEEVGRIG
jgi:hypothetical protein